jgi:hypothetical protein
MIISILLFRIMLSKNKSGSQALAAHACNPSYSGGRDQEDQGLKLPQANCLQDSISRKGVGGVVQMIEQLPSKHKTLSSNPHYCQKIKNKVVHLKKRT